MDQYDIGQEDIGRYLSGYYVQENDMRHINLHNYY
jgi:hypothetical protein